MTLTAEERTSIEAKLAEYQAQWDSAWGNIVAAVKVRGTKRPQIATGWGGALTIYSANYGTSDADEVIAGKVDPIEVLLTEDGRAADVYNWHSEVLDGQMTGESVYAERWTPEGRTWHGYVDPVSRKTVQTG